MKQLYIILLATAILASSCGGNEDSVSANIEGASMEDLRTKKKELAEKQREIEAQIAEIDAKLESSTSKKLPLVTTYSAKTQQFDHFVELQGNVTTRQNVLVYPEAPGTLVKVYVSEGDKVSKGQLLATIDNGGMGSQLAQLKTQLSLAKTTYERQKRLWEQNIGTEIQYLQAKANYEAQQDAVNQLNSQLDKYNVRAPFAGVVDDVIKDQGTVVAPGPGSEIFRVVNLSDMYIEVAVPETYVADISQGKKVTVYFPILGDSVETTVRQAGNYINPDNRSFTVEIPVPSLKGKVKPNLTARVRINDYTSESAILVPQSVISENAEGEQYAYVADNRQKNDIATANKHIITTGKTHGDLVEILSGIKPGDAVIKEGARSVKDGQEVQILKTNG